ncbi:MAG: CocE/NonD family hydrolase [Usitatibacter sp.]
MSDSDEGSKAWKVSPGAYMASRPAQHALPKLPFSRYVTMRDGVRIAVDVYLPQGLPADTRFPTLVIATPYYRRFKTEGAVAEYSPMAFRYRDAFVPRGYAMVVLDVRGTGASFGVRDSFRSPNEREDFREIADWIVAQAWSNGAIGATGISYPGAASVFLAGTGHPAVKAIAPLFAIGEIYADQLYPGGMLSKVWTGLYNDCIVALDHNKTEEIRKFAYFGDPGYRGPAPVDEDPEGVLLQQAMHEHQQSFNLHDAAPEYAYRGEGLTHDPALTLEVCSPYHYFDHIRPEVAIYSCSGWFDGSGYSSATVSRFNTLKRDNHFMVLGPWDHGARTNGSPWRDQQVPRFNLWGDVVRFFDRYLMGRENGIEAEQRIHYFSVHGEEWRGADAWPPVPRAAPMYLSSKGLVKEKPVAHTVDYQVDFTTSTGRATRYERLGLQDIKQYYPDWNGREEGMATFETTPFEGAMELTGHAVAHITLESSQPDAGVFVYLSEVDAGGKSHYVTEGMLRALHRATAKPPANYVSDWPYHPYTRAAAKLLERGRPATLDIGLLPVSWVFAKGSRLRVAIAGADAEHFPPVPHGRPPKLTLRCGGADGSTIELPMRPHPGTP